jgi:hypothetical protein
MSEMEGEELFGTLTHITQELPPKSDNRENTPRSALDLDERLTCFNISEDKKHS